MLSVYLVECFVSSTHYELRGELTAYLTAPADKKQKILAELWSKYGDRITATMK